MEWGVLTLVASACSAISVGVFATFRYFISSLENARRETVLLVDKQAEHDGKMRHDLANSVVLSLGKIEGDVKRLERESVRREEMTVMEARLTTGQEKIATKVDKLDEKIDQLLMRRTAG